MLIETCKFAADFVAGGKHHRPSVEGIVHGIAPTVGKQAVGIGIACSPLCVATSRSMLVTASELPVVGKAALIEILGTVLVVGLCIHSCSLRITAESELVHHILELQTMAAVTAKESHIEQSAQTNVTVILVVDAAAQVVALVVGKVIGTEQVVRHTFVCSEIASIVQCGSDAEFTAFERHPAVPFGLQTKVGNGLGRTYAPIVVETGLMKAYCAGGSGQRGQLGADTSRQSTTAVVETEEIGRARCTGKEGGEMGSGIHISAKGNGKSVVGRDVFGRHLNESSAIVGRIDGTGRLDDGEMVNLRCRDDVERKRPGVGLAAGNSTTVNPHIVIALRESAHHDELVLNQADARDAAYHLAGIAILCPLDFLCGDVVDNNVALACSRYHGVCRIPSLGLHHPRLAQHLVIGLKGNDHARGVALHTRTHIVQGECRIAKVAYREGVTALFEMTQSKASVVIGKRARPLRYHHCGTRQCLSV